MRNMTFVVVFWLAMADVSYGGVVLTFTLPITDTRPFPREVEANQTYSLELRLSNQQGPSSALSAYQFDFQGGDFGTGKLDASNWQESNLFTGLVPAWLPDDQSLNTAGGNFRVSGVSGSLSTPFMGPSLPINEAILIGTFDVFIDAPVGSFVDFLLAPSSGIDDELGRLAGQGLNTLGIVDVPVVPEPNTLLLLLCGLTGACFKWTNARS